MDSFQTYIIIGAPRSGTNLLRDVLTSIDGIATWPCDEINYIWRYGNARYPSDEFPPELACPEVSSYIQARFAAMARRSNAAIMVEKTCANSLRVPFVHKVMPSARFIYIYRNGLDAAASAKLRWKAALDLRYVLRKARYVPVRDLPYYCMAYLLSRAHQLTSSERRLASWGPRLDDMQKLLRQHTLAEVCGLQWQRCVESAEAAFETLPQGHVLRLDYDTFVRQPGEEIRRILEFMGHRAAPGAIDYAVSPVRVSSLGKSQQTLTAIELDDLRRLIGHTLDAHEPQ